MKWGVFAESNDEFVNIGKWDTQQDAEIAIAEHGLDRELGEEYYTSTLAYRMVGDRLVIEPGGEW